VKKRAKIWEHQAILWKIEENGSIHACPVCHRYLHKVIGCHICALCGTVVDNNHRRPYSGRIIYDGGRSWKDLKRCDER
jgi:hypothetical protein